MEIHMVWTSKLKDLDVTKTTGHHHAGAGVTGRALGIKAIHFTPLELFGAAARCSHVHFVNPALATPESQMIASLIEQYVDDTSNDFAILATANNFKDFVKSYFAGTVASGLAYLALVQDGYSWVDHFENITGGNPLIKRSPDYVFTGNGPGTALLESKGTRSDGLTSFDSTVEAGYLGQVEPHLGYPINGVHATHGYTVGSWMTSTTKAEMIVHHTAAAAVPGGVASPPSSKVQQHNYATALSLVHSPGNATQLRQGRIGEVPTMLRFEWLDRSWLLGPKWMLPPFGEDDFYPEVRWFWSHRRAMRRPEGALPFVGFAMDEATVTAVFSRFSRPDQPEDTPLHVEPLPEGLRKRARDDYSGRAGAVFPDGLAVVGWGNRLSELHPIRWNDDEQRFL